jgi:diguanylate cyclase (GGDEF)-like protein
MVCPQAQTLISEQLDGEIPPRDREFLDLHLSECPNCRSTLDAWSAQHVLLQRVMTTIKPRIAHVVQRVRTSLASRTPRRCSLLVVDDESYLLPAIEKLLHNDYDVITAQNVDEAESILQSRMIDILLTDQRMPEKTGVQLLEWARQHSPQTIRLLMTGYSEIEDAIDAINRGNVYYYLLKPWRTEDLLHVLRNAADKFTLERKRDRYLDELWKLNGELERRVMDRTRELEDANQLLEQRARELERLALTDPLTGLFNRRAMDELARFELKRHARYPSPLALGYIDVDHFKDVNTRYLLTGGDEVLKALARMLSSTVRETDSVGRVGGEEFLVIARETTAEGANVLAERIRATVANTPIRYGGQDIGITVSVGFAVAEIGVRAEYQQMTELAAAALAQTKLGGRNRVEIRPLHGGQVC